MFQHGGRHFNNFQPGTALTFDAKQRDNSVLSRGEKKKKHACEKGQYTHKTPPSAPFAIVPDLKHYPHKFQTLFSPVQALVFALHTLKQVSVSYGKTNETWSAPHPYLVQPSSNSRRTTSLCLRPPLSHRTHPPPQ